jgi:hypothetical protein
LGFEAPAEPRKIFLGFLITALMEIEATLYSSDRVTTSANQMIGLIQSLDKKSKEALKTQYDNLLELRNHSGTREDYEKIYTEITDHLHKTWLRELRARPRMTGEAHLGSS